MNNKINERIRIANSFKSLLEWGEKSQRTREKTLKWIVFLEFGVMMIFLPFLIIICSMNIFNIELFTLNWSKSGLLVMMTMLFALRSPVSYIELILYKHINKIKDIEIDFDNKINIELANIIDKLNRRFTRSIPTLLIMIPAMLQTFDLNPYWDNFLIPTLVVSIYLIFKINYDILKVKTNLGQII